ncbi:MAG: GntR family transcriptional regulator [Gammaproteobacteria bacterium]|nr:GntR family transcriptional regulator [Gammaproteobacteria bacterium]
MANKLERLPALVDSGLKDRVFSVLRQAVVSMDIYGSAEVPKLDERALAEELGVSRTPVREALSRLEQEGLVSNIPRRGTFVVRKTKSEIIDIIAVWAALESMAARLATETASDQELEAFRLRWHSSQNESGLGGTHIDEYSEHNIRFHQDIIELSRNNYLIETAGRSFAHMRAIRASTIKHPDRTLQSIIDHQRIVTSLVGRETNSAEKLVREHALKLALHVKQHVDFLD